MYPSHNKILAFFFSEGDGFRGSHLYLLCEFRNNSIFHLCFMGTFLSRRKASTHEILDSNSYLIAIAILAVRVLC